MTAPNPNQPRAGVSSTPSSAAGTRANVAFNDLIRKADRVAEAPEDAAPEGVVVGEDEPVTLADFLAPTPDEVVLDALVDNGWLAVTGRGHLGSIALTAVLALRNAGYDL